LSNDRFWELLDKYNEKVKYPPEPGTEYFIQEMGPLILSKTRVSDDHCHGCGSGISTGEFYLWFPRELFYVGFRLDDK